MVGLRLISGIASNAGSAQLLGSWLRGDQKIYRVCLYLDFSHCVILCKLLCDVSGKEKLGKFVLSRT